MKKLLALALCLVLTIAPIATIGVFADNAAGFTKDESTKTYTVTTADGLLAVAAAINLGDVDYNIVLAADIDLAGKTWTPIGTSTLAYKGTFDGKNFTISNLTKIVDYQTVGAAGYAGLIGKATEGCTVKNVKFTGASIMGVEFTGLVIGETAQANAEDTTSKVTIENVHIRNSDIKGSNGWGTAPTSVNKNEYTGAIIGKAVATHTVINNCTVVANITSECRTAGIVGGESVGSGHTMTISNCVVGGAISQNKVATGSGSVKDGGATAFVGYNDKFVFTLSNCVSVATLSATNGSAGALTFNSKKTTMTAINCVVTGNVIGKALDTSVGSNTLTNVAVYDTAATADKVSIVGNLNGQASAAIKVDGVDTTWGAATVPVLNTKDAFKVKIETMFASNETIKSAALNIMFPLDIEASGMQLLSGTTAASEKTSVRLVITLTSAEVEALTNVGAYISLTADAKTTGIKKATTCVYTSIKADDVQVNAVLGTYFVLVEIQNIPNASFGSTIYVTPFVTAESGEVLGEEISFNVTGLIG